MKKCKQGGIYLLRNLSDGKVYIGKSIDLEKRLKEHKLSLIRGNHHNNYLQNAWNKYGENNFEVEILFNSDDREELNEKEIYFIKLYKSNDLNCGYNLTSGGEGGFINEEVKMKMSISARGKRASLSVEQVRCVKLAVFCLMDRKEISNMFGISTKAITQIVRGVSYNYILPELNDKISDIKQSLIKERNIKILELFDSGLTIKQISDKTDYSISIIEKCVYRYRNPADEKRKACQKKYDEVMKLKEQGYNNFQISKMLGLGSSTVKRYVDGVSNPYKELPFKKITEEKRLEIIDMYFNKNIPIKEISRVFNVSKFTIEHYINNYKYANTEVIEEIKKSSTP